MATPDAVTVLKYSLVSPPSSAAVTAMSLPLTFLDMHWLHFPPIERLVLYEVPQLSRAHFIEHIIPKLEHSLSLTLQHFLPLAGNLIVPSNSNSGTPEIRYKSGSSLALIIAECTTTDFNYLTANHARNCCDFHPLIPELKPSNRDDSGSTAWTTPVLALQVTLFPDCGMSVGISNHHTVGDAGSVFRFMKTWAALCSKCLEDNIDRDDVAATLVSDSPPCYDRTMIKDPKGLSSIFWDQGVVFIKLFQNESSTDITAKPMTKTDKVRRSFVISRNNIEKLKRLALQKRPQLVHLSSFTVICAHVWTCLVKCRGPSGEPVDDEEAEHFYCLADCRGRMDPPLPSNYFGNCQTLIRKNEKNGKLIGEEGFPVAVELIGEGIHQRLKNNDSLFDDADTWLLEPAGINLDRLVSVAGSPRYNYYNLDFGWGKPKKFEFISIDTSGAISLSGSRESDGDIEVGLSLSKPRMDAFTVIFNDRLNSL
ncbi:phenolic glucoside malonyltransferase 1-like [Coffea arabica]|uniref:Phenolic glucoside malonyltransferase 1-like n=1 Tax=Coffea arabica TaxID=13443 RepID=A0A6P6S4T4_COFAR|nr:malonyl-coenzyme A:anthocyanin 3-O-glucoside-6''-O-malonyltransferase-like [Coffea arabica]